MVHSFTLPTLADLTRLAEPHDVAITIYLATSPVVSGRELALTAGKSAVDEALRSLRAAGASHGTEAQVRAQWDDIAADGDLWGNLASSLAIFITTDGHEVFVLPNDLDDQRQVSSYFDLGQLVRSIAADQHAYALTLSANEWSLWESTATSRASEIELAQDHPRDAAEATNRSGIRARQHVRRLVGDEGRTTLLETYAQRVAEAVDAELRRLDPSATVPLFVFGSNPLLAMYTAASQRAVIEISGAPDQLRADQIDAVVREHLPAINAARISAQLERIANDIPRGLVRTDLAEIARYAALGAVDALVYEFTVDVLGTFDETSGAINLASDAAGDSAGDDGGTNDTYDLLSRIAVAVHRTGGEVVPVRSSEVSGGVWNGVAVAHLRYEA